MRRLVLIFLLFSPEAWGGGQVSGVVTYRGIPPAPKVKTVTLDSQVCGRQMTAEDLLVGKKGEVRNAVAYLQGAVEGARSFPEPPGGFVMDQKGCRFDPHVLILGAGSSLELRNSDRLLHTICTQSRSNPPLNKAQPASLPAVTLKFSRPEIFGVRCDRHEWMQAWLVVAEHPYYALTDEKGLFRLADVPAGDYTLALWHESLGTTARRIRVREGEETRIVFKLTHPLSAP